jgi:hypothetical protein
LRTSSLLFQKIWITDQVESHIKPEDHVADLILERKSRIGKPGDFKRKKTVHSQPFDRNKKYQRITGTDL